MDGTGISRKRADRHANRRRGPAGRAWSPSLVASARNRFYRLDARRTITLGITPPDGMALGPAVAALRSGAEKQLFEVLPPGASLKWGGDADSLARAVTNLGTNFLLAIAILFLIMAALFKSVKDSALVIITLPMATVGGHSRHSRNGSH